MVLIMTFGEKIKAIRLQLNMSQEMLARELGVSFATVNRWENARTKPSKNLVNYVTSIK